MAPAASSVGVVQHWLQLICPGAPTWFRAPFADVVGYAVSPQPWGLRLHGAYYL